MKEDKTYECKLTAPISTNPLLQPPCCNLHKFQVHTRICRASSAAAL